MECGSDSWQSDSEDYFDVEHSAAVGQAQHSKYHIIHLYVCLHVRYCLPVWGSSYLYRLTCVKVMKAMCTVHAVFNG